jgi:hypothetical protein
MSDRDEKYKSRGNERLVVSFSSMQCQGNTNAGER